ncbi:MAG: GNAT family N-acetyltransferase [Rhodobacter sp.]|nr:GNAT family N-acetyltransferase [Rhodobacter sp.]
MSLIIRAAVPGDTAALARLFHAAVHRGTGAHYNAAQRAAWSPKVPDTAAWAARLAGLITLLAEDASGVQGFISLRPDGLVDFSYVAPDRLRQGIGTELYRAVEARARRLGLHHLTTEASLAARPFFARHGWQVIASQEVERRGVKLLNFRMEKRLHRAGMPAPDAAEAVDQVSMTGANHRTR